MMLELTNTEQMIMKCIWSLGEDVTVADLLMCLKQKYQKEYARTTISVFMSYLRDKGYVTYGKKGHAYVYKPLVSEKEYQCDQMKRYLDRCFDGNIAAFVETVLYNERPGQDICEKIRALLDQYRSDQA